MPTGYTAPIYHGEDITFEQFANSCLRNFGIGLRWRNESDISRYEVPDKIEPDDYYKKQYEIAKAKYDEFIANPPSREQVEKDYIEYVNEIEAENKGLVKFNNILRARYMSMLEKVENWAIPSEEYRDIKKFMRNQLLDSIDADCDIPLRKPCQKEEWISFHLNRPDLAENMIRCLNDYKKAVAEAENGTKFLKAFTKSIKEVTDDNIINKVLK